MRLLPRSRPSFALVASGAIAGGVTTSTTVGTPATRSFGTILRAQVATVTENAYYYGVWAATAP